MVLLRWSGLLAIALGATGCSLIYDADDLTSTPPIDAGPPDASIDDANITALELTRVSPAAVPEGSGTGASRPALVVVEGSNIEASLAVATVAFEGEQPEAATVVAYAVEPTMSRMVVALTVPVLPALGDGETARLILTVTQAQTVRTIPITVSGLDELAPEASTIATEDLRPLYSRVDISSAIHFTGSKPAIIRAVGDIDLAALVDADASGATAGPGGCAGATSAPAANAGCGGGAGGGGSVAGALRLRSPQSPGG